MVETNKMVELLIKLVGTRENILDYTIGDSNLVLLEIKDVQKLEFSSLEEKSEIIEVLLQGNILSLHLKDGLKDGFANHLADEAEVVETEKKNVGEKVMDAIQGIFAPILAPLAGAGILQGITIVLTATGIVPTGNAEEAILNSISGAVFYFMPILLAFSAAKVFKASPFLAATIAGFLLHPDLITGMEMFPGSDFFNIPIQSVNYANSVIPIILIVWAQSYIEKFLKRIMPEMVASILNPLLILVITSLLGLMILGPIGNVIGQAIASVLGYFADTVPWLVPTLMGA